MNWRCDATLKQFFCFVFITISITVSDYQCYHHHRISIHKQQSTLKKKIRQYLNSNLPFPSVLCAPVLCVCVCVCVCDIFVNTDEMSGSEHVKNVENLFPINSGPFYACV